MRTTNKQWTIQDKQVSVNRWHHQESERKLCYREQRWRWWNLIQQPFIYFYNRLYARWSKANEEASEREREEKSEARPLKRWGRVQPCQGHGWVVRPRGTRLPRRAASPGLPPLDHSGIPRGLFTQAINTGGSSFYSQHCQSYLAALLLYFSNHFSSCN